MEYLVGGYTMLNDFDLPGGKQLRDVGRQRVLCGGHSALA